ncbi:CpsD/CapB family tyrosine-protein kinase [Paenibacillus oenotherae]|uniref:non-specific protein-tyrosine kinase n=1 Tax=Paenibacillus oenotherae TaxID=1435645 RepID=A0ABS7D2X3_9BACL|nr:CpsD/CapB family tyrosine-protein kinase [Paenibacillus oenotherae]MBW7474272.1 CpsD/CapB family tyrosine-protein kinase [Paenibacillus oenotherae]
MHQTNVRSIITDINPLSSISEAYRTLRTNLQYAEVDRSLQLLMVTSANPKEGKTTTINNLAVAYAQTEKSVLLVDADLRKPTAHHTFQISNRCGLTHVLTGKAATSEAVKETHIANLSIMPSGSIPPNPSELLGSRKMDQLLEELRGKYDHILIDTPPVLAVSDAQIMASRCDGVLLVVNARSVKRQQVVKARDMLQFVQARIVGVALNQTANRDRSNYYEYQQEV